MPNKTIMFQSGLLRDERGASAIEYLADALVAAEDQTLSGDVLTKALTEALRPREGMAVTTHGG